MGITPEQLKTAEERWIKLRDAGDPAAAEAEKNYQDLARSQTQDLQQQYEKNLISKLLK